MEGGRSVLNYLKSGKWDFLSPTNRFAPYDSGTEYFVPKCRLRKPGLSDDPFFFIKGLLGQRLVR